MLLCCARTMKASIIFPAFVFVLSSLAGIASTKVECRELRDVFRSDGLATIDAEIEQAISQSIILGGVLWVERNGVSYHKAFGLRAAGLEPESMTEDTIFDVASITKVVVTTSAVMLCVERKLLNLDDPVSKYIREFTGDGREKITIRHLLLHTSGILVNLDPQTQPFSNPAGAVALACRGKPAFEPGSAYAYSSVGFMILGIVIERATGRALDEFCTTEIFRPLQMNDTGFRPGRDRLRRVSPTSAPKRGQVDDKMARAMEDVAGHASLFSTASDLARFARMMLNLGELDNVRIFRSETIKLMTGVQTPTGLRSPVADNMLTRRGLGWNIDSPFDAPPHAYSLQRGATFPVGSYGHAGWTGQMLWIDPFSRTFIVFLCNRYHGGPKETPLAAYLLHYRLSTLAGLAVKDFDFKHVPGSLPGAESGEVLRTANPPSGVPPI